MDVTEETRRVMVEELNSSPGIRESLEKLYGQVWDTQELRCDFDVTGFMAPFVMACRKSDGKKGTLMFQHLPRFYWGWFEDVQVPAV